MVLLTFLFLYELFIVGDPVILFLYACLIFNASCALVASRLPLIKGSLLKIKKIQLVITLIIIVPLSIWIFDPIGIAEGVPRSLRPALEQLDIQPEYSKTYCLNGLEWAEWLWKIEINEDEFSKLGSLLGFDPIEEPNNGVGFSFATFRLNPLWWRPKVDRNVEMFFYAAPSELNSYSSQGLVVWNPETQIAYFHVMDKTSYRGLRYPRSN